jgi:hypothetical protein
MIKPGPKTCRPGQPHNPIRALQDDLFGTHRLGPARYSHITAEMRCRLLEGLTDLWNAALDQRMNYSVGSPVGVLDTLLRERRSLGDF